MVDAMKKLLSPKVMFPIVGVCVLLVVAALVAVFYVRNPSVTDNLFSSADSTTPSEEDRKMTLPPYSATAASYSFEQKTSTPDHVTTDTTTSLLRTLAMDIPTSSSRTVEPPAIEPVKHE